MLLEYVRKCDIIKGIWRVLNIMFELFLIAIEKLMDNPKITTGAIIISLGTMIFWGWRAKYVFRRVYVEKKISTLMRMQLQKLMYMMFPIICFTEIMVKISNAIYEDGNPHDHSFLIYYIPMLLFVIYLNASKIKKERKESYIKSILWMLPGISFHGLFLAFIVCGNKSPIILGIILMLGIIVPPALDVLICFMVSPKDRKMVKVELTNKENYNIRYNDLLERKNDSYIRLRSLQGRIEKTIIVKREDIIKKTIYIEKPNINMEDYYYKD